MREYVVGTRVECDGFRGTILYIGEVPPTKGTWLGVEWDDPSRGKHSGSHEGVQYFVTRKLNAGSFVRMNKIKPNVEFSQALSDRYLKGSTDGYADKLLISELRDEMNAPFLELVGFEKVGRKQSNLRELSIAVLDHLCIDHSKHDLGEVCPNIEELDLSSNLLNSWVGIAAITSQLPRLAVLNVSDNKLAIPENPLSLKAAFSNLTQLQMSHMDYTWGTIVQASAMWPRIEVLAVPNNNIKCLEFMDSDVFNQLRVLNLEGNHIEYWEEVNKLGQLPNLEQLSLYGCGLRNIQVKEKSFSRLSKLSLSNNRITQWEHISELDKLPMLVDLKLCSNQGFEVYSQETFSHGIIARIGNLQIINGSQISSVDRRGAELDYLKQNGNEYLIALSQQRSPNGEQEMRNFEAKHPRYKCLVQKYGPPEQGEYETKPTTLKNALIMLRLEWGSNQISKKLPVTMEVQKLKVLIHRLFNLHSSELTFFSYGPKNPGLCIPLDNDLRPLSFYSIEDGDTIVVKESV